MRDRFSMKAFALTVLTIAIVATGCGGGADRGESGGWTERPTPAATPEPLAHADAVQVTYYYLPG